jgi:hypothetical protein
MIVEFFKSLQAGDWVWVSGVGVAAMTTLVQKLSTKYKPWSWLARQLGKAMNAEILEKLDTVEKKVDKLESKDKQQDEEREKEKALDARRRILNCADECRRHIKHSEEFFNNVLEDVSYYKNYCDTHPSFENEKAVIAINVVSEAYKHCIETNDFL